MKKRTDKEIAEEIKKALLDRNEMDAGPLRDEMQVSYIRRLRHELSTRGTEDAEEWLDGD